MDNRTRPAYAKVLSLVVFTLFVMGAFSVVPVYATSTSQVNVKLVLQDLPEQLTAYPQFALNSSNYFTVTYLLNNTNQTFDLYQNAIITVDANSILTISSPSSQSLANGSNVVWGLYHSGPQSEFVGSASRTIYVMYGIYVYGNPSDFGVFLTFNGNPYTSALGVLKSIGGVSIAAYNGVGFAELNQEVCLACTFAMPEYFISATGQYWQVQGSPNVTVTQKSPYDSPSSFNYVQVPAPRSLYNVTTVPSSIVADSNVMVIVTFPFQPGAVSGTFNVPTSPLAPSGWSSGGLETLVSIPPGVHDLNVTVTFTGSVFAPAPVSGTVANVQQSVYSVTKVVVIHVGTEFPWWLVFIFLLGTVVAVAGTWAYRSKRRKKAEKQRDVKA